MTLEQPKLIEPVSLGMVGSLLSMLTPIQRYVLNLSENEIDITIGRGVFDKHQHCLWTTKGKRITVTVTTDMGLIVSVSASIDPIYKELAKKKT